MSTTIPQHITDLVDSMIKAYPTGLPDGIHLNINLNIHASQGDEITQYDEDQDLYENRVDVSVDTVEALPPQQPEATTAPSYKGQFLGLYRVVPRTASGRIKIRSHSELKAAEATVKLTDRQYAFIKALNPGRIQYLETSGYIFTSDNGTHNLFYKQFGFEKQLLVIAEIRRVGEGVMGRVVGIGSDPYLSDPKPLDVAVTNYKNTPWLVHLIDGVQIYAPILTADSTPGWVDMQDVEKVR